jgi:hypothetical protein
MKAKCVKCGNEFEMGLDGVVFGDDEQPGCDSCLGIERDIEGSAWEIDETEHIYCDLNGENEYTVTREEAFRETN